jgi:hypothetical protein
MALYGREGAALPLGPAVQHTGELPAGPAVEEIWTFGEPERGVELPGMMLERSLAQIPSGVRVRRW